MKSYDRYAFNTVAVIDAVIWAARRARRFEQRRQRARMAMGPEKGREIAEIAGHAPAHVVDEVYGHLVAPRKKKP